MDARLLEVDFGAWDGHAWNDIETSEITAWTNDIADHAPGAGESVRQLMARCREFMESRCGATLVVGHAGWWNAARWIFQGRAVPGRADEWPAPLAYAASESAFSSSGGAESQ